MNPALIYVPPLKLPVGVISCQNCVYDPTLRTQVVFGETKLLLQARKEIIENIHNAFKITCE